MRRIRRGLSYANVAATLALVFSMTGGAYALIVNGGMVQDESLTGADVRDDSLRGSDILESSLGRVPLAAAADTAAEAGNADTLDGRDATAFVQGSAALTHAKAIHLPVNVTQREVRDIGDAVFSVEVACLQPGTTMGAVAAHLTDQPDFSGVVTDGTHTIRPRVVTSRAAPWETIMNLPLGGDRHVSMWLSRANGKRFWADAFLTQRADGSCDAFLTYAYG